MTLGSVCYLLVIFCDLNVTVDILACGICKGWLNYLLSCCSSRYKKYEVEGEDSGSDDEIVDYSRRCCIRYNHIKKLEARRQIALAQVREEIEEDKDQNESAYHQEAPRFVVRDQNSQSSSDD